MSEVIAASAAGGNACSDRPPKTPDIASTQVYTHVDSKRLREVVKKYHPRG